MKHTCGYYVYNLEISEYNRVIEDQKVDFSNVGGSIVVLVKSDKKVVVQRGLKS